MIEKEYVKRVSVRGNWDKYSRSPVGLKIRMKLYDGRESRLNTTGTMTIGEIVKSLVMGLGKK